MAWWLSHLSHKCRASRAGHKFLCPACHRSSTALMRPDRSKQSKCLQVRLQSEYNGGCAHYVMVSKIQWKPFWLASQLYPQNDWTGWQNGVNDYVFGAGPSCLSCGCLLNSRAQTLTIVQMNKAVEHMNTASHHEYFETVSRLAQCHL